MATAEPLAHRTHRDPEECATIVYTSGSMGAPKGAMLSFGAMAAAVRGLHERIPKGPDDRMLSYLPLAHVFERWFVEMSSLFSGHQVFFLDSIDTFFADVRRARPTMFVSVPRLWQKFQLGVFASRTLRSLRRLLRIPIVGGLVKRKVLRELGMDAVRVAASGSAPISTDLIRWYRDLGLDLMEGYGMTENFCYSHISRPGRSRVGYVGEAYPGVDVRLNETGEIEMRSQGLMMGYYREPQLTADAFTDDGFLKTGDQGEMDEHGRLRITGRVKERFKTSKGKYVAPTPIENRLQGHEALDVVCVVGSGLPQPLALAPLSLGRPTTRLEVQTWARLERSLATHLDRVNESLDPHERVARMVLVKDHWRVENGFLTPTMKIRRAVVEHSYPDRLADWADATDPVIWEA